MGRGTFFSVACAVCATILLTGCGGFGNRSGKESTNSTWLSFPHIQHDFKAIEPYKTTASDLGKFGFGEDSPNVKRIDYLRLRESLVGKDAGVDILPLPIQTCLSLKDACRGLIVKVRDTKKVGLESFSNRILEGQKTTEITGWEFEGIVVIQNDMVVYAKPRTEDPNIRTMTEEKDPRSLWEKLMAPLFSLGSIF